GLAAAQRRGRRLRRAIDEERDRAGRRAGVRRGRRHGDGERHVLSEGRRVRRRNERDGGGGTHRLRQRVETGGEVVAAEVGGLDAGRPDAEGDRREGGHSGRIDGPVNQLGAVIDVEAHQAGRRRTAGDQVADGRREGQGRDLNEVGRVGRRRQHGAGGVGGDG